MLAFFLTLIVLWIFYKKYTAVYKLWESRGIPYVPARFPFGSDRKLALSKEYSGYLIDKMYKKFEREPYFGIYNIRSPTLVVRDPEIVRLVLAKEFSHFRDRIGFDVPKKDILSNHLFALEGERWRALRVKLSPTFTSGRLRGMFPIFVSCAEALDNLLLNKLESNTNIKDVCGRFTTDIICSCAFGLEVNSVENSENKFRQLGATLTTPSLRTILRSIALRTFPDVVTRFNLFNLRFRTGGTETFLLNVIKDTVRYREDNGVKRNDFLDLLMELRGNKNLIDDMADNEDNKSIQPLEMTIELMTAQCFVFFVAGFETSSSVQSYCLYELSLHPEIQERLQNEIDTVLTKHGGVTYEAINEMEYLDMVVSETMRKYPTLVFLTRRCTKPFTTPSGHRIEKGDSILIPTWSLHHDPQYFPDPEKFDPERFSANNKDLIKPYVYLPFGEGPRICIGMRFGLLQTKMGIITILKRFKVEPCEHTTIPLELMGGSILTMTKGPIILKVTKRISAG